MNLLVIKRLTDGSYVRSLLNYPSENEARVAFYNELAYSVAAENIVSVVAVMIDDEGHSVKYERFSKPVEIAEPEFFDDKEEL